MHPFRFTQIVLTIKEPNTDGTILGLHNNSFSNFDANTTLNYYSDADLTGTVVKTKKSVSVLVSSECFYIPPGVKLQYIKSFFKV